MLTLSKTTSLQKKTIALLKMTLLRGTSQWGTLVLIFNPNERKSFLYYSNFKCHVNAIQDDLTEETVLGEVTVDVADVDEELVGGGPVY